MLFRSYILIFSHKGCGIFHLGMSGSFLSRKDAETKVPHTHLIMRLSKRGSRSRFLHFVDPRRFGRIGAVVLNNYENHPFLRNLGPEPLELPRLGDYLYEKSRKSSRAIKTFLMDAKNIVGLGNIYVCESLYQARISPFRAAGQVSRKEFQLLGNAIKKTLRKAIKQGGTTLKDFKNTEGNPGYFKVSLKVYGRTGLACENCKDSITLAKQSGRSSWFCSFCQK